MVKRVANCVSVSEKETRKIKRKTIMLVQQDLCAIYYRSSRTLYCNVGSNDNSNIVQIVNDVK